MNRLLDEAHRRRLYILASFVTLGLQACAYLALLVLWGTKVLDKHLFSLSHLSLTSQVISVVSQALVISSLAALTFFVQAVAADRVIRRPQKLAAIQDLLDAWHGLGSSVVSIWRGRRLGRRTTLRVFVIFLFFAASSVLYIVVPATVTVQLTNSTIPVTLRVTQPPHLTDLDFSSLGTWKYDTGLVPPFSFLPGAVTNPKSSSTGIPPGVEGNIWFNTLPSPSSETVTFIDTHAQKPAVRCVSIPRRSGDQYEMVYSSSSPGSAVIYANIASLLVPYDGAVANFSTNAVNKNDGTVVGFKFGGEKASKEDPPNDEFNDTVLYLPWSPFPDNSTRNFGNIAFVLISSHDDALTSDSFGLEAPANQTLPVTVWSWITNSTLSDAEKSRSAFQENMSVTFYFWPIVCTMRLENLTAQVRGDNTLVSYSEPSNDSRPLDSWPFVRAPPSSAYERAWSLLFDEIRADEQVPLEFSHSEDYDARRWLEVQVLRLLNETTSNSTQKISALEAGLQDITSAAYPLVLQQFRANGSLVSPDSTADVQGQQQIPMAKLHVNGLQTVLGLLCVIILLLCVMHVAEIRDGLMPRDGGCVITGDVLDFMCLMRGSSLPGLLAEPKQGLLIPDPRRDKAEKIDVVFNNFKLDAEDTKKLSSGSSALPEPGGGDGDALAATERALARLPYIRHDSVHASRSAPTLTNSLLIVVLALAFLCCLHITLIVLWARHTLNHLYFNLSKLGAAAQAIAVISQICTVGALGLLSYGLQRIAADKFIRKEQTVQDLQGTLGSLLGIASAFHALWDGFISSRRILTSVAQLYLFWLASSVLHITMPTLISVNTAAAPTPAIVEVDTMPGNIIDLGANITLLEHIPFNGIYSDDLLKSVSAISYLWENRNASIRLPLGIKETTLFSTPSNVSSSEYIFSDPYARSLSVRCGVIPPSGGITDFTLQYGTPQTLNAPALFINAGYQYTLPDGVTPNFTASVVIVTKPGALQFGGEKSTYDSPPNMYLRNTLLHSNPVQGWNAVTAERGSVSFLYVSLDENALAFPSGVDYAPPTKKTVNLTVLSWVNETTNPTTMNVNAFNESVAVTFYFWPLACVLTADQATATIFGNGTLESSNASSIPPNAAFPFMTNEPENQIESNWVPLLGAIYQAGCEYVKPNYISWLETAMQSSLDEQPSLKALEDSLAILSSLAYALLIQGWRNRYATGDATLASIWTPQYKTVAGEHLVLRAHLQVNGIPLLVGSLSVLVLGTVSALCIVGHGITDNIVRDGGVIDLVSLLHNSALPDILAGHEEDSGDQEIGDIMFMTRRARARGVMVAYGYGSLDIPRRIHQREIERLDALSRSGDNQSFLPHPQSSEVTVA